MRAFARAVVWYASADPWEDVMTKIVVETPAANRNSRLQHFLRIERQAGDRLLQAAKQHPQPRATGNARVVAFCRIARGHQA
jgi:hypothetical protein